ncbi:hypothetical protein DFH28DRAFT_706958 [Melampsora americana]|nr:hypothetical protein DFH28DRAFT_706958 [Melampsora americana]
MHATQSDSDIPTVDAISEVFKLILTRGHNLGAVWRAHDNVISRLESEMENNPNNQSFRDEHNRKLSIRDQQTNEIESFSRDLAQRLQSALPSISKPSEPAEERIIVLENQLQKLQRDTDRARSDMTAVVQDLMSTNKKQAEEIADLRCKLDTHPSSSSFIGGTKSSILDMINEKIEGVNQRVADVVERVADLHKNFILVLSEDIPSNLQQAIRAIQESTDAHARNTSESCHRRISELFTEFSVVHEARLDRIEQNSNLSRCAPPQGPIQAVAEVQAIDEGQTQVPNQKQAQVATSTSKDPRLRRQSAMSPSLTNAEPHTSAASTTAQSPPQCQQQ